jgi:hypothetical protein
MLSKNSKRFIASGLLFVSLFAFSGCGPKYESQITEQVQKNCKIPESFRKVAYKEDDKNGIAYLDFKAKNLMGVEVPDRVYFVISDKGFSAIPTQDIDKGVLENFLKTDPANFQKSVKSYRKLKKAADNMQFDEQMLNDTAVRLKTGEKDNFFTWKSFRTEAAKYNIKLKAFKDAYSEAPDVVKNEEKFKNINDKKYVKVTVTGNWRSWQAKSDDVDEYPDTDSQSN